MEHSEMVALIRSGVALTGGVWADLGAGTGNFTWALAELLGPHGLIYAIDRDARAIAAQQRRLQTSPPLAQVLPRQADVTRPLDLPPLDGILLANLLHFVRDQVGLLQQFASYLKPHGRIVIVEYEQSYPIAWVPFPVPLAHLPALAEQAGFAHPGQLGQRRSPSSGRVLYAALLERATPALTR